MRVGLGLGFGRGKKVSRPFVPTLVSGLQLWLDASDVTTITHSGNAVSQWNDKSTHARHVSQGGASTLRPTYDGANGKIGFDGGDYLYNTSPFMYANGKIAIYAVLKIPAANGTNFLAEGSSSSNNPVYIPCQVKAGSTNSDIASMARNDANTTLSANNIGNGATAYDNTKRIVRLCDSGTTFTAHVNGAQSSTIVDYVRSGTLTLNRFAVGTLLRASASGYLIGDIYEIIVCADDSYGSEIEGYLAHKHGMTGSLPSWHPYKSKAPVSTDGPPALSLVTGTVKAALMGDSITAAVNVGGNATTESFENMGYFMTYNALSSQRMLFPVANNKGVAGNTTAQMVARLSSDLESLDFDTCFVMGGINDVNSELSTGTIISNLAAIVNYVANTLGKRVVLLTILPRSTWPGGFDAAKIATAKAKINTINAWIMAQHGTRRAKVVSVDTYTNFSDGSDVARANITYDGLHPSPYGAMQIGLDVKNRLTSYYGSGAYDFSTGNLLSNGLMSGTGGTVGSNFTGSVATGYTASGSGGTGGRTASKNGNGSQRLAMAVSGGTSSDTMRLSQTITSGFSVGDTVYGLALVEISGTPAKINRSALEIRLTGSGAPTKANAVGMDDGGYVVAEQYMTPGQYLIFTPDLSIASGTGLSLEWRYEMKGDSSAGASNGIIDVLGAGVFKR